jgi:hypothetical protein
MELFSVFSGVGKWPEELTEDFVENYWEKKPVIIKSPTKRHPILSLNELFSTITSKTLGEDKSSRFWAAKEVVPRSRDDFDLLPLGECGPCKKDGDFKGFFERYAGKTIGINIHGLDKTNKKSWRRTKTFRQRLTRVPGRPEAKGWAVDTFFGNYKTTPLGIHRDPASVFSFGLMGKRIYFTWPPEYFDINSEDLKVPDPDVLDKHIGNAERFELDVGDMVYWPSNRWHVITSNGEPSVVVQTFAWFDESDLKWSV